MTQKIINVMIDLETLGTKPGCKILSIGACTFGSDDDLLGNRKKFYQVIEREGQLGTEELETVTWWNQQSAEAQKELFENIEQVNILDALTDFSAWIRNIKLEAESNCILRVWGNSASFDLKILEAAYNQYAVDVPWSYRDEMCYRTLKALFDPEHWNTREFQGTPHVALDDAIFQAEIAEEIFEKLASKYNVFTFTGYQL